MKNVLRPGQARKLAQRLRAIAADPKPAQEWDRIAADYRRMADEIDAPTARTVPTKKKPRT